MSRLEKVLDLAPFFVVGAVLIFVAHDLTAAYYRHQAIDAGVARWDINPRTGQRHFVYGAQR